MEKNMETAAFWIDRMGPAKRDELLAPESRIRRLNRRALEIQACEVNDVFGEADPEGGCAAARPERRGCADIRILIIAYGTPVFQKPLAYSPFKRIYCSGEIVQSAHKCPEEKLHGMNFT